MKRTVFSFALLLAFVFTVTPTVAVATTLPPPTRHTIAIKSNGTLWAWGDAGWGQLGGGTTDRKTAPVQIGTDADWVSVATGVFHAVAIKSNGTIWAWGQNKNGQLGDRTITDKTTPVQVGTDRDWACVVAGGYHTVAIKTDGTIWAWGINGSGQLGNNIPGNRPIPAQVGTDADWVGIAAGWGHTVAIKSDGSIWTWGSNSYGQLGDGESGFSLRKTRPTRVGTDTDWVGVAAGNSHTIAIKSDGTLWAWGKNWNDRLDVGSDSGITTPARVGTDTDWLCVPTGIDSTVAVKSDGTLWAWGDNYYNEGENMTFADRSAPMQIGIDTDWVTATAGGWYNSELNVAVKTDGSLWTWGGDTSTSSEPKQPLVKVLDVVNPSSVSAKLAPNLDAAAEWARSGITNAVASGFVPLELQNEYTDIITRAEFCHMAVRWLEYITGKNIDAILAGKAVSRDPNAFTDTDDPYILAAYASGITNGTGDGTFTPDGQFTREQAAAMIRNTCKAAGMDVSISADAGFEDIVDASDWAIDGINFCNANGIMTGTIQALFKPQVVYTREQSIVTFGNIEQACKSGN